MRSLSDVTNHVATMRSFIQHVCGDDAPLMHALLFCTLAATSDLNSIGLARLRQTLYRGLTVGVCTHMLHVCCMTD